MSYTHEQLLAFVGTAWVHTPKAVKKGNPENRVFTICNADDGAPKFSTEREIDPYLIAWKCIKALDGKIEHPAFPNEQLPLTDKRLYSPEHGSNGSEPTAWFIPDSYYTKIS